MKAVYLSLAIILCINISKNCISQESEIFTVVEVSPKYPDGEKARLKYLQKNIEYPKMAREMGIQETVFITFVVEIDGSINNVKVLRGIGGGCDEEAVRVIKEMPKWEPGTHRGKAVRVQYNIPIKYTLTESKRKKRKREKREKRNIL